ncbi:MAG: hypothetical protein Q7U74_04070, partial [Saprospiraceae bacterium]|nr:hypothetical protein [Saprospiraceae bacterium]
VGEYVEHVAVIGLEGWGHEYIVHAVGEVIGFVQHGWKKAGWFALAGIIGFNMGYLFKPGQLFRFDQIIHSECEAKSSRYLGHFRG